MTIDSKPQGALVYLNGQEVGRTPLTRDFTWYGNYDVILRREGYETLKLHQRVNAPVWQWIPLDLAAELMPMRLQDKQHFSYALVPASTQPVDPAEIITRARQVEGELQSGRYTRHPTTAPTSQPTTQESE